MLDHFDIGIILLSAGSSSRLGRPKQLLPLYNTTLLQYIIDEILAEKMGQLVLVTGAYHDEIIRENGIQCLNVVRNENWQEGMSSSIVCGLIRMLELVPDCKAVIIVMSDQPYFHSAVIEEMINTYKVSNKAIVQCQYEDGFGPPVLFDRSIFSSLMSLTGNNGARSVIQSKPEQVAFVSFPKGNIDIDTEEDYNLLKRSEG